MIYLIRHTRPDIAAGICYGQSDIPLAPSFDKEMHLVKSKLAITETPTVISSPLHRCKSLATALYGGSRFTVDERLMEMSFGDWELQAWDEIDQAELTHWSNNFVLTPCPNGECMTMLSQRVLNFWNELKPLHHDYVLITHAGVIRVILAHLLQSPLEKAFTLDVNHGEVIRINVMNRDNCNIKFIG